ncbi:MAG: hypothetical protein M3Q30_06555 [Actinomycetota bacterium]|nr:hypothetical protein [Actinomycetota bacterium]
MTEDDLSPIDLEPVDLEPVGDESRLERARDRRSARVGVVLVAVGFAAWAVIALATRDGHSRPASTTPTSEPHVDRLAVLTPRLRTGLRGTGSGRFAAVIDDRLYLLDEARPDASLVRLPEGHVTIADHSGSSLLASTFEETIVSTRPVGTRTLSPREVALRAVAPAQWWFLRNDGTIRSDRGGELEHVPPGLRVVAAVRDGFVALDARSAWVLWSHSTVRPIGRPGAQLLTAGPRAIAFKKNCGYNGCALEILDLAHGTVTTIQLSRVPEFAAFSPDGTRLALATTLADVYIFDTKTGVEVARTHSRGSPSPSLPFTWTPDSRALLVVQDHDVEIVHASAGLATRVVAGTDGLQQLAALP